MEIQNVRVLPDTNQVYLPGSKRFYAHANYRAVGPKGTHEHVKVTLKIPVRQQEAGSFVSQRGVRSYNFKIPRFDPRSVDKFVPRSGSIMRVVGTDNSEDPIAFANFSKPEELLPFRQQPTLDTANATQRRSIAGSSTMVTPNSLPSPMDSGSSMSVDSSTDWSGSPMQIDSPVLNPPGTTLAELPTINNAALDEIQPEAPTIAQDTMNIMASESQAPSGAISATISQAATSVAKRTRALSGDVGVSRRRVDTAQIQSPTAQEPAQQPPLQDGYENMSKLELASKAQAVEVTADVIEWLQDNNLDHMLRKDGGIKGSQVSNEDYKKFLRKFGSPEGTASLPTNENRKRKLGATPITNPKPSKNAKIEPKRKRAISGDVSVGRRRVA